MGHGPNDLVNYTKKQVKSMSAVKSLVAEIKQ